jgi:hypothetical protein
LAWPLVALQELARWLLATGLVVVELLVVESAVQLEEELMPPQRRLVERSALS